MYHGEYRLEMDWDLNPDPDFHTMVDLYDQNFWDLVSVSGLDTDFMDTSDAGALNKWGERAAEFTIGSREFGISLKPKPGKMADCLMHLLETMRPYHKCKLIHHTAPAGAYAARDWYLNCRVGDINFDRWRKYGDINITLVAANPFWYYIIEDNLYGPDQPVDVVPVTRTGDSQTHTEIRLQVPTYVPAPYYFRLRTELTPYGDGNFAMRCYQQYNGGSTTQPAWLISDDDHTVYRVGAANRYEMGMIAMTAPKTPPAWIEFRSDDWARSYITPDSDSTHDYRFKDYFNTAQSREIESFIYRPSYPGQYPGQLVTGNQSLKLQVLGNVKVTESSHRIRGYYGLYVRAPMLI